MKRLFDRFFWVSRDALRPSRLGTCLAVLSAGCILWSCAPAGTEATPGPDPQSTQIGYVQAPRLTSTTVSDRSFLVGGSSAKGARIRLSSPEGQAFGTTASDSGAWVIEVPRGPSSAPQAMLFGLSEDIDGRIIQAEGYVALLPDPRVAAVLLRAGIGAQVLKPTAPFAISAADFDSAGGLIVSGFAAAGRPVKAQIDGAAAGEAMAGADGRFTVGLAGPPRSGERQIGIEAGNGQRTLVLDISSHRLPARSLAQTTRLADGWRIDWTTPSGGVQSTYIDSPAVGPKP